MWTHVATLFVAVGALLVILHTIYAVLEPALAFRPSTVMTSTVTFDSHTGPVQQSGKIGSLGINLPAY
jgi:formaldehyde-activating enzyme involved in methanogenesis